MANTNTKGCDEWKLFMVMIAIDLAFAILNILLQKVLDQGLNHLVLITYRLSVATVFLAPVSYFLERKRRPKLTLRILCYLFFSAIVGTSLAQYFFLLGVQYTSATFSCAFNNMVPVVTFMMALPFGFETLNIKNSSGRAKVLGTLISVGGAMMLTLYKGMPLFNHPHSQSFSPINHGLELGSSKRIRRWTVGCVALIAGTVLWSSWFLIQSFISRRKLSVWVLKGKLETLTVLYAGMVGSGLCFVGMSWCVRKRGPVFTAAFSPLIQIMAGMIDIPLLHEELHLGSVLGSMIVIIGMYILLWGRKKEMPDFAEKLTQEAVEIKGQEAELPVASVSSDSRCS
ncbi:Nodulin MtN21 /EamA-like transporter family protein [Tripterygium wilfordii]|uniref:WAT1-related protein n=1 Tax=Tripterygium wilfordii TaxID=458696 RepID=A0A7J7CJZ4_TRIWF|nr:WAT1-related protein At3g30340 isoform X2 [Tripterygium wilfordii]KAF5734383.1 Nodulin MtN21 /EamA-like transporter family protein [Tripterygium wilfordii]